ncbi:FAD-binding oxidoreductase [Terriglobus albidus]|uniref:FAD-binding oxidoreductase n=1 Tax=Terriglobus albidus TaxID=1592106 RepID=A0A5B9EDW6_9BACT|nr:FAD-binding oxidoreductase [Terriglobus albidus]QEE30403.1 FAD-binding oxidoreductase [Terriglobus albidus]
MSLETDVLAEFRAAIGEQHVLTEAALLRACETATFPTTQQVFGLLQPASAEEVAACVKVAANHRVPLYPISRGRNWGLGSRVPSNHAVLLDLSRMNRILHFDERFGCLTLEPGVTFEQVHAFLIRQKAQWFLPTIGGPPDASVLGNFLERGDGIGPRAERTANMASLQVVLGDGSIIDDGYARFEDIPLALLSAMPAGPAFSSIFTQSNLGVVTRMTVSLARRPSHLQMVYAPIPDEHRVCTIDALQQLQTVIGSEAFLTLWNGGKLNARGQAMPQVDANAWFLSGALYGHSSLMAQAQKEAAIAALASGLPALQFFDESNLPDFQQQAGIYLGQPSTLNLQSLYAASQRTMPETPDPDRDGCGAIWLCPEIPFDGATIVRAITLCETILRKYNLSPILGMSALSSRTVRFFVSILYDRTAENADENAMQCHDEMQAALLAEGFYPYRLGIQSMNAVAPSPLLERIKAALDPKGILAPGRY